MRFHVVDTLTGKIVGRLYPTSWAVRDPLREPGFGELVIAKPSADQRDRIWDLTRPRRRWVAVEDDSGAFLWGGVIPRRPVLTDATITIKPLDWRTWFYRAPLRPSPGGVSGDYIVKDVDQATIAAALMSRALVDTAANTSLVAPPMVIDTPELTGVKRERTLRALDRSVGEYLDGLVSIERGIEWWTYVARDLSDPTRLEVHATIAYPERKHRTSAPVRLEWREGVGGNVAEKPSWPEGAEAYTRVWATGDGEPPAQVYARSEDPDGEVLWEAVIGPLDGVKRKATAYEHAFAERSRAAQYDASAEFLVTAEKVPLADVRPGDRARVIYDDGWESVDVPAARIVERVVSGGHDQPTQQRLIVDLSDVVELELADPGVPGEDEDEEA